MKASYKVPWKINSIPAIYNLWWKHHYLLGQIGNADEIPEFLIQWPTLTPQCLVLTDGRKESHLLFYFPDGVNSTKCRLNSKQGVVMAVLKILMPYCTPHKD